MMCRYCERTAGFAEYPSARDYERWHHLGFGPRPKTDPRGPICGHCAAQFLENGTAEPVSSFAIVRKANEGQVERIGGRR